MIEDQVAALEDRLRHAISEIHGVEDEVIVELIAILDTYPPGWRWVARQKASARWTLWMGFYERLHALDGLAMGLLRELAID